MNKVFVLPPRQLFTREEKRKNLTVEDVRLHWRWEKSLVAAHALRGRDPEMRWLAELFPLEVLVEGAVPDEVAERRLTEWCSAHPNDASALAYLANLRVDECLMEKAASMGDSWAMGQIVLRFSVPDERRFQLACAPAEQGDATGSFALSRYFRQGFGCEKNEGLADVMLERAADLGSIFAYETLLHCQKDAAFKLKLLCVVLSIDPFYLDQLSLNLDAAIRVYMSDGSFSDAIFEAGEVLKGNINVEKEEVFGKKQARSELRIFERAVSMYDSWCNTAGEACVTWILIAKQIGIQKDVRKMIAKMVWEARSEARGVPLSIKVKPGK